MTVDFMAYRLTVLETTTMKTVFVAPVGCSIRFEGQDITAMLLHECCVGIAELPEGRCSSA